MGRRAATDTGKTTLNLDAGLKERAARWALKNHRTLTDMVEEGLRLVMAKGQN
jgi:hypothetical protein